MEHILRDNGNEDPTKNIGSETELHPKFIMESVSGFINQLAEARIVIPGPAKKLLGSIKLTERAAATAAYSGIIDKDQTENLDPALLVYANLLTQLGNDDYFWSSLPEYIPLDEEIRTYYENCLKLGDDPQVIDTYPKEKLKKEMDDIREKLKGDSKEEMRTTIQTYANELKKGYSFPTQERNN